MKLENPFTENTRNLFLYEYSCFNCGRSDRGLELHHILGRQSANPLNAIPLCLVCHSKAGHSFEEESKYLQLTLKFLVKNEFEFKPEHIEFYIEHKR